MINIVIVDTKESNVLKWMGYYLSSVEFLSYSSWGEWRV